MSCPHDQVDEQGPYRDPCEPGAYYVLRCTSCGAVRWVHARGSLYRRTEWYPANALPSLAALHEALGGSRE